jgi:hypothetical protein
MQSVRQGEHAVLRWAAVAADTGGLGQKQQRQPEGRDGFARCAASNTLHRPAHLVATSAPPSVHPATSHHHTHYYTLPHHIITCITTCYPLFSTYTRMPTPTLPAAMLWEITQTRTVVVEAVVRENKNKNKADRLFHPISHTHHHHASRNLCTIR